MIHSKMLIRDNHIYQTVKMVEIGLNLVKNIKQPEWLLINNESGHCVNQN